MAFYRDGFTFCEDSNKCDHGDVCSRAITSEIMKEATKKGEDIQIYPERRECFHEKQK